MDIFQQLRGLVNGHSERLLFYEHFLENNNSNSLLLDFDKKGRLIFLSQTLDKNLKEMLKVDFDKKKLKEIKEFEFFDLFDKKHEFFNVVMKNLQKKIRLKNLKEFLVNKMNYLGPENQKSPLMDAALNDIKVIVRAKSKSFKGFYILVPVHGKGKDDYDDLEEEE